MAKKSPEPAPQAAKPATKKAAPKPKASATAGKPAGKASAKPAAKPAPVKAPKKAPSPARGFTDDDVSLRAYFIAERRHKLGWPGDSTSDWVEAERQLTAEAKKKK